MRALSIVLLLSACGTWVQNPKTTPTPSSPTPPPSNTTEVPPPGGGTTGGPTPPGTPVPTTAQLDLTLSPSATPAGAGLGLAGPAFHTGQTSGSDLRSLRYFLTSITICKDAVLSGSAYSNLTGCIELFNNPRGRDGLYDRMDQVEAAKPTYDADFIDLMKGIRLSARITRENAGTYKYATVGWMKPIRMTAQAKLNDPASTILYTHAGVVQTTVDQSGIAHQQTVVAGMDVGPATEAISLLENGGSVFAFGQPFTISAEDVDAGAKFGLDMVFNPEGMAKAADSPFAQATLFGADADGRLTGHSLSVPALSLIPLMHKAVDRVMRETYLIHFTAGLTGVAEDAGGQPVPSTDPFDVRLEVYHLESDPDRVYAAHTEMLYTPKTMNPPMGVSNVFSLAQDPTTKAYSFFSWQGLTAPALLSDVKRLAAIGDVGTAQIRCAQSGVAMSDAGCYDAGTNSYHVIRFAVGYELVGRDVIVTPTGADVQTLAPVAAE